MKAESFPREFSEEELKVFRKQVGKNVAKIRKEKGLSQLELSQLLGYKSVSLVAGAEVGFMEVKFSLDHLYKIATVLDVNVKDFFEGIKKEDDSEIAE